jgi:Ca2+-binding EF-hand superfamily protein
MKEQEGKPDFKDLGDIIEHMDVDHNGRLAYNEFISACLSKSAANNRDYLYYAFRYFDINRDGKISREELSIVLKAYKK